MDDVSLVRQQHGSRIGLRQFEGVEILNRSVTRRRRSTALKMKIDSEVVIVVELKGISYDLSGDCDVLLFQ